MNELKLTEPWITEIGQVNIQNMVDMDILSNEIFTIYGLNKNDDSIYWDISEDIAPLIIHTRDNLIANYVKQYMKKSFKYDVLDYEIKTFAKCFTKNDTLGAHLHGDTHLTCILYPNDTNSGLIINDPKGNACRGYPKIIRDTYFGQHVIYPKAGDLIIMPSYLEHGVSNIKEDIRISLICDFKFTYK